MKYRDLIIGKDVTIVHQGAPVVARIQRIGPHQASAKGWRMATLAPIVEADQAGDPALLYMPVHETELAADQA